MVLLILLTLLFAERCTWLFSKDFPNATDSFFYLQEFKSRLQDGHGYYVQYSFFFWFWSQIARITALNEVSLYNLIFISSLLIICSSVLIRTCRSNSLLVSLGLIYIFLSSDLLFYRHYAFLKQGFAVSLLLLGLSLRNVWGLILVIFASLTHIFACAIAIVFLFVFSLSRIWKKSFAIPAIFFCLIFLGIYLHFNPKELFQINNFQSSGWWGLCRFFKCSQYEVAEFIIATFSLFIIAICLLQFIPFAGLKVFLAGFLLCIFLNMPIWTKNGDMLYRLSASSYWIYLLCLTEAYSNKLKSLNYVLVLLVICYACCFNFLERKPYSANKLPFSIINQNKQILKAWIPEDSFILAEHGLEFPMTYFIGRKSADKIPSEDKVSKYFQIRYNLSDSEYLEKCSKFADLSHAKDSKCVEIDSRWAIYKLTSN